MGVVADIRRDLDNGALRLVAECRDRLYAKAVRLCKDTTEAEDLVSWTFAKAIQKLDTYTDDVNLFGWLYTIMVNLYKNGHRKAADKMVETVDSRQLEEYSEAGNSTMDEILRNSDHDALREALSRLDPEYKKAMVLHYFGELPVKNIALALHLPLGTVLWRMSVARKMLANDLGKKLGKKPVAVLAALCLGLATAFGAYKAADALGWIGDVEECGAESETLQNKEGDDAMNLKSIGAVAAAAAASFGAAADATVSPEFPLPLPANGQTLHLDASACELGRTLFLDENGYVTNWTSKVSPTGETLAFTRFGANAVPYWSPTVADGRPAVYFGEDRDTHEYVGNGLVANKMRLVNRTAIFVFSSTNSAPSYGVLYGQQNNIPWFRISGGNSNHYLGSSAGTGWAYWYTSTANIPRIDLDGVTKVNFPAVNFDFQNEKTGAGYFYSRDLHLVRLTLKTLTYDTSHGAALGENFRSDYMKYGWRGRLCEALIYDRDITEEETEYVTACMKAKWFSEKDPSVWVGGASGDWDAAANWSNGVPDVGGRGAAIITNAAVTITANRMISPSCYIATAGGQLRLNGGIAIAGSFVVPTDYALVTVGDANIVVGNRSFFRMPATVAGGCLSVLGNGQLKFCGAVSGAPEFTMRSGTVDLNGTAQTFASFSAGFVTNTAATAAALTVAPQGNAAVLSGRIDGDIALTCRGEVALSGFYGNRSGIRLEAASVAVATNFPPIAMEGLEVLLDASDPAAIVTNALGQVVSWKSYIPKDKMMDFTNSIVGKSVKRSGIVLEVDYPYYSATACNGRPAVEFGYNPEGKIKCSALLSGPNIGMNMVTAFAVMTPYTAWKDYDRIFGGYDQAAGIRAWSHDSSGFSWRNDDKYWKTFSVNGRVEYENGAWVDGGTASNYKHPNSVTMLFAGRTGSRLLKNPTLVYDSSSDYNGQLQVFSGNLAELIVYNRELTEAEYRGVQAYLMEKWGIAPDSAADLSGVRTDIRQLAVTGGVSVVRSEALVATNLVYDMTTGPARMWADGVFNVTNTSLKFEGDVPLGTFLRAGELISPFADVSGLPASRSVNYKFNRAYIPGGLLLFLR